MHDCTREALKAILEDGGLQAVASVGSLPDSVGVDERASALRQAGFRARQPFLYYQGLHNVWSAWGRPSLKPGETPVCVHLIADATVQGLVPYLEFFGACYGLRLEVKVSAYDSVEQVALSGDLRAGLRDGMANFGVLILSEHWLSRYLGGSLLVARDRTAKAESTIHGIVESLAGIFGPALVVSLIPGRAKPMPGGLLSSPDFIGWNAARRLLNQSLLEQYSEKLLFMDTPEILNFAGGWRAYGGVSYERARIPYEACGTEAVGREIVALLANSLGRSHRALLTDFDNTLWGGVIAEVGGHGVLSGQDGDGFGFHLVQNYARSLGQIGVLLGGLSRNDPSVVDELDRSSQIVLTKDDFATLHVGHNPKSQSISEAAKALGFGSEFMVLMDDSLFELIECLAVHPFLDVVRAADPQTTLERLTSARFFETGRVSTADGKRVEAVKFLAKQRDFQASFTSIDEFLKEIAIKVTVSSLCPSNEDRIEQLFQKTNQFNLTTRRHTRDVLNRFIEEGHSVVVFSYEDTFGPQGIISVVVVKNFELEIVIDSWLMSCRVLNRGVEQAVFSWLLNHAGNRTIRGIYRRTAKNELVRTHYEQLGFRKVENSPSALNDSTEWVIDEPRMATQPKHHCTMCVEEG